ncbi:SDR family NAD(P)-dependent oxidoreductase [Hoeflea sp. CAU 1731]
MTDLTGRIALVTGASRGIGYFTSLALADAGAHVIAVARTVGGLEELDDAIREQGRGSATLVPQDLLDMKAIDKLGAAIFERWGKLDILVANAAILGTLSPVGHYEARIFDKAMNTNVNATWRVIRTVDPLLAKSDAGRAVIVTSGAAHSCRPFHGLYASSKAAVEALARCWAAETINSPLRVNCVNPGPTRTAMRALAMPGEDPMTLPHPSEIAGSLVALCDPELTETGMFFDVPEGRFKAFQAPN